MYIFIGDMEMARPKPEVLLEYVNPKNYKTDQILVAEAIFAVFYEDKPVNLRVINHLVSYPGPKYKKISFSNKGHAFNLMEKLNKMFKTDKFKVYKLSGGHPINEND